MKECLILNLKNYILQHVLLTDQFRFEKFLSLHAHLSWTANLRPDMKCGVALLTQITEERFKDSKTKFINNNNNIGINLKIYSHNILSFLKLDKTSVKIPDYADASFATDYEKSSSLGYSIFLIDKSRKCKPNFWSSHKCRGAVGPVMKSELMAFVDGFELAYSLKHDFKVLYGNHIPLRMIDDCQQVFEVLTWATCTTEKRFNISPQTAKDAYKLFEFDVIVLKRSDHNIGDTLNKSKIELTPLDTVPSRKVLHSIQQ